MTEDAKAKRKAMATARKLNKLRLAAELPACRIDDLSDVSSAIIELKEGFLHHLTISQRGEWAPSDRFSSRWRSFHLKVDIHTLGPFLRALIARYNYMVREANKTAEGAALEPLTPITSET